MKAKPDKDRPNLNSVKIRIEGGESDCKAFIHFLQQCEERDLLHFEQTPSYYPRNNDRGSRRGKPLAPKPSQAEWGHAYFSLSFAYPDYPELK